MLFLQPFPVPPFFSPPHPSISTPFFPTPSLHTPSLPISFFPTPHFFLLHSFPPHPFTPHHGFFTTKDMQTPSPLSIDPVFMDDGQCAEKNEKNNKKKFQFFFPRVIVKNSLKIGLMTSQNDLNSKNKNRRIFLLSFSFYSAHSAYFINS